MIQLKFNIAPQQLFVIATPNNSGETMKCTKIKAVIGYYTLNKRKEPEVFFHHLLMLYYPWRDKEVCVVKKELKRLSFIKETFKL